MKKFILIITALFAIGLSHKAIAYDTTYFSSEAQREFNNIMAQVKSEMSDVEKLLAVHDYMVLNFEYDNNHLLNTAEDMLANKRGSCQGYAEVMICIMDELGLENAFVRSEDMVHSWNMVRLDDEWYHIDVTWDDPGSDTYGYVRHDFFLVSDEYMLENSHYGWKAYNWDEFIWYEDNGIMDINATSHKYDEYFWHDVYSYMQYYDRKWYCILSNGSDTMDAGLNCYSFSENKAENIIASYEILSTNVYNGYIYILDEDNNIYMTPVDHPSEVAWITTVNDYNGKKREEINGVFIENGSLKYVIADDKYYEMEADPEYGDKAKYPDYVKYRKFYSMDLKKYRYLDYAINWTYEDGVLSVGSRSEKILIPAISGKPWNEYRNDIVHINIQNGIKIIGNNAFSGMQSLESISLPDSLEVIEAHAFQDCISLKLVEIPENVSTISEYAFEACYDLAVITLGHSISNIEEDAFRGCRDLAEVYYSGSETDFNKIAIGDGNFRMTGNDIFYNYEPPMQVYAFTGNDELVILWLYNNKATLGECVLYQLKRYYEGDATDYSEAAYSFDDRLLAYENNQLYGIGKGQTDVSITVGDDELTFRVYVGEWKKQSFTEASFGYDITPIIASYTNDGSLINCRVGNMNELYENGIEYIDYGGENKLLLWKSLSSMQPVFSDRSNLLQ